MQDTVRCGVVRDGVWTGLNGFARAILLARELGCRSFFLTDCDSLDGLMPVTREPLWRTVFAKRAHRSWSSVERSLAESGYRDSLRSSGRTLTRILPTGRVEQVAARPLPDRYVYEIGIPLRALNGTGDNHRATRPQRHRLHVDLARLLRHGYRRKNGECQHKRNRVQER